MFLSMWFNQRIARRSLRDFDKITNDPKRLAEAIEDSQLNGLSDRVRIGLVSAGREYGDNVHLTKARSTVLESDPCTHVRAAALYTLFLAPANR